MRRILALGGGGIKGAANAAYLAHMEASSGRRCADCFDLIVGTSTGGISAIALSLGVSAQELVNLYREDGPNIFPADRSGFVGVFRQFVGTKYSSRKLRCALFKRLSDRKLGDAKTRLVIPACQPATAEMYLFKTRHHSLFKRDHQLSAIDVALATSAAPTYFPQHVISGIGPFVDGGLWANNPVGLAVVEAITYLGWPGEDLSVLCLETPQVPQVLPSGGGKNWLFGMNVMDRLAALQSSHSIGTALVLMKETGRMPNFERFFHGAFGVFPKGYFGLDNVGQINALIGLGDSAARKQSEQITRKFFHTAIEPFHPVPMQ